MDEISKTCSPVTAGGDTTWCSRDSGVTLTYGLERHQVTADLAASGPCEMYPVSYHLV